MGIHKESIEKSQKTKEINTNINGNLKKNYGFFLSLYIDVNKLLLCNLI